MCCFVSQQRYGKRACLKFFDAFVYVCSCFLLGSCFLVCMVIVVISQSGKLEGNLEETRSLCLTLTAGKAA